MVPEVGLLSPEMVRRVVVFPAPLAELAFRGRSIGEIDLVCQAKFNLMMLWGVTHWLQLRACPPVLWRSGARKGADAETVTGGLQLARRAENRGNLGKATP